MRISDWSSDVCSSDLSMKPGSVVVDLAIEAGGNVEGAEYDEVVTKHGVKIVAYANVPGRVAEDASKLFARNLLNFLTPMIDKESKTLKIDTEDETVSGTMVTRDGAIVHAAVKEAVSKAVAGGAEA